MKTREFEQLLDELTDNAIFDCPMNGPDTKLNLEQKLFFKLGAKYMIKKVIPLLDLAEKYAGCYVALIDGKYVGEWAEAALKEFKETK